VWSCVNGHANSPRAEYCATCGAWAGTGTAADQQYGGGAGTEYASDYASGSFAEYIDALGTGTGFPDFPAGSFPVTSSAPSSAVVAGDEARRTPGTGFPAMLSAPLPPPPAPPAQVDAPPSPDRRGYPGWLDDTGPDLPRVRQGWYEDGPSTRPGPVLVDDAVDELRYRRPTRTRMLVGLAAVAILGITGITGTLVVMHSRNSATPAGSAQAASSGQPGSASASPVQSGAATQGVAQWTTPVAIDPQTLASGTSITALSCAPGGGCYAADSAGAVLALHSAGNWPVSVSDPNGSLVALSCPVAGSCLAIDSQGLSTVLSHGSWSHPAPIGTGSGTVTSVSCASPDFCLAVDTIGQAFTYAGPSVGWSQRTIAPNGHALYSVSCASRTQCVAVGASGQVYRYTGSSWSGPATVDDGHDLVSVSCPSAGFCMAVDSAGQAVQFSAGHWAQQPLGFTATSVSCPAVGTCLAVGSAGVATYGGDHWTGPSAVDTVGMNRIDCVAVNSCVATDQSANALFYSASAN
jgi:hypothetical protein